MDNSIAITALAALAHPKRLEAFRAIVASNTEGVPSGVLAEKLGLRPSTMSVNLNALSRAGLVTPVRRGKEVRYHADLDKARRLISFLFVDCCGGRPEACGPWLAELADDDSTASNEAEGRRERAENACHG